MDKNIGNDLLAEFLGYQKVHYSEDKEELQFDTDWNDLMHVVDKCLESQPDYDGNDSHIKEIEHALINGDRTDRKHNVWLACVKCVQHEIKKK